MSTQIVLSFALSAVLGHEFRSAFNNAGKMMGDLGKQVSSLEKSQGQIAAFQKMQGTLAQTSEKLNVARMNIKNLGAQMRASEAQTSALRKQFNAAQTEASNLSVASQRSREAYTAGQKRLAELKPHIDKDHAAMQEFQKLQHESIGLIEKTLLLEKRFKAASRGAKKLEKELRSASPETDALKKQFKTANIEANTLQTRLAGQRRELGSLRTQLKEAGVDTRNLGSEQARLASQSDKVAAAQKKISDARAAYNAAKQRTSWDNIKGDLAASAAGVMALKVPITTAMNFEQAMSGVEAVSFGGKASTEEQKAALAALKEQALELGSTTQFTAMQAAQSQENLARAGFTSSQILKAMPGLLDMAAAEGMDLSSAASIAANALRGFNMDASESGRVADVLAKTSAMTNTSISGLGEAMKYVAPVASGLGVSVEETAALLGAMANAGIDASMGGTALRAAFTRLSKEPKAAAKALAALGVASRSANGDMRRLPIIMEDLSKKTAKMGDADRMKHLTNIFGTEAASGMLAIMKAVEKGDLANFEEALKRENVTGTANAMAKARTDNLAGDLTALSSAWEGLNNTVGSAFTPVLRDLTQFLTNTLNKVNGIAKRFPTLTKYAARFAGMFVLKKTVLTGFRIGKDLLSLPILAGKVANATLEASAATGKLTLTQKAAYAFMKVNQYLWDGAKFVGYKAKTLLVAGATKVLAGAQWVLHGAMKAVHAATKAWTAAQWLWNAAMNANPIGAVVIAVGLLTAAGYTLYKNWDKIKQFGLEMWDSIKKKVQAFSDWWDSWTLKDIFAAIPGWCDEVLASLRGKWDEFCNWLKNLFSFNLFGSMDVKVPAPGEQINERHLAAMTGTYLPPEIPGHALGGIITHPMISWLAEDGDEAVVPLENRSRGIPLWMAAGERMGLRFGGGSTTANNYSYTGGSPTINITVSGGGDEPGIAQRIAQAVRDALEDIQSYEGRVAFA